MERKENLEADFLSESDDGFDYEKLPETGSLGMDDTSEHSQNQETCTTKVQEANKVKKQEEAVPDITDFKSMACDLETLPNLTQAELERFQVFEFIREFFAKMSFDKSLSAFDAEAADFNRKNWFSPQLKRALKACSSFSEDLKLNSQLITEIAYLKEESEKKENVYQEIQNSFEKLIADKKSLKRHLSRIQQEKVKVITNLGRVKRHCEQYEPVMKTLRKKYDLMLKEKTLMRIQRDRFRKEVSLLRERLSLESVAPPEADKKEGLLQNIVSSSPSRKATKVSFTWGSGCFEHSHSRTTSCYKANGVDQSSLNDIYEQKYSNLMPTTKFLTTPSISAVYIKESSQQSLLLTGTETGDLGFWSMPEGKAIAKLESAQETWISSAVVSETENKIAASGGDGNIKIWDLSPVNFRCVQKQNMHLTPEVSFKASHHGVWCVNFCHMSVKLLCGTIDGVIKLYDTRVYKQRVAFRDHLDAVNSVLFSNENDNVILSSSADKTISLWDARSGHCEVTLFGHTAGVNDSLFHPRYNCLVASGDSDGTIIFWDVRKVSKIAEFVSSKNNNNRTYARCRINKLSFSSDGSCLAAGDNSGSIKIFQTCFGFLGENMLIKGLPLLKYAQPAAEPVEHVQFLKEKNELLCCTSGGKVEILQQSSRKKPEETVS
eukprot:snap_masked-scaffold_8-processed-gene-8.38-mRNA-1 protein AED:0.33 eAED:0.33 QI:0/-1/0/1/-1/1/1/0/661